MIWGIWWTSRELSKILKFALWETFLSKVYNAELKNYRRVICCVTEGCAVFKEKLTGGWKDDIKNLVNFTESCWKSENLHFDGAPFVNSI